MIHKNKDYQIRALKGVVTKQRNKILNMEKILDRDFFNWRTKEKYIVRYKDSVNRIKSKRWRYFLRFREDINKIINTYNREKATRVNKNIGKQIINRINNMYDNTHFRYRVEEIELDSVEIRYERIKRKVSRFELMDI